MPAHTSKIASLLGLVSFALVSGPSSASAVSLARFPLLSSNNPNPRLLGPLGREFDQISASLGGVTIVAGRDLKKRLGGKPAKLLSRCGADLKCIAGLGRRAKVTEVMLARVSPGKPNGAVTLTVLVVDSKGAAVSRRVTIDFAKSGDIAKVLRQKIPNMFGATAVAKRKARPRPQPTTVAAVAPAQTTPPSTGSQPSSTPAEAEPVPLPLTAAPPEEPAPAPSPPPAVVTVPEADVEDDDELDLALVSVPPEPAPPASPSNWTLYTGLSVVAVGAVVAGSGGAFYSRAEKQRASAVKGVTNQIDAKTVAGKEADSTLRLANTFIISGAVLALLGGGLVTWALMDEPGETTSMEVGAFTTGNSGMIQVRLSY